MKNTANGSDCPTLPQNVSPEQQAQRQFDLALARTSYNYMRTYIEPLPLSADVPAGENFSIEYEAKVVATFLPLAENFKKVVIDLLERELKDDLPGDVFTSVEDSYEKLASEMSLNVCKDIENLKDFTKSLADLPQKIRQAIDGLVQLPKDLEQMLTGMEDVFNEFLKSGVTAFLKSTMIDMLRDHKDGQYLRPRTLDDYANLFSLLPKPTVLTLEKKNWMPAGGDVWEHDWFFGYLQIAGFNTTNLLGVKAQRGTSGQALLLSDLQKKMPVTDPMFQSVIGRNDISLQEAAEQNRLFVCDYPQFSATRGGVVHGEQRYLPAPIALFYWNPTPPEGFPSGKGALQPIAIQLGQAFNAESTPIFTPNNCSDADDANGFKWKIAKFIVNSICAVQHETVAHLGACHLTVEPVVVASHRQLPIEHPLMKLLLPHFRFTIEINDSALHSLIVPGGVVATVIGPTIESTGQLLVNASAAWRWDEHNPEQLFNLRGVDSDALPDFPFRDDTMLLWNAIKKFVGSYVAAYYPTDQSVADDYEVQGWVNELVSPLYAGFKGLTGLKKTGNDEFPVRLDSRDYLVEIVSHIIYIAGPQHASVNYAQFPLMTYSPAVSGTIYTAPPQKSTVIGSAEDCMKWYPPLDIALYIVSFGYLLSGIQFDTFGQYSSNPRIPYFTDSKVAEFALDFQEDLAEIEKTIRQRNRGRPMPYHCQLPSMIPNSISI
jgi:arachidonate 15-lipoxygenase